MQGVGVQTISGSPIRRWHSLVAWLVAAAVLSAGCTTLKAKRLPPEALQAQIRDGSILQAGDEASIVTEDGKEHVIKVSAVGPDEIAGTGDGGESVTVLIDDVLALRTREVSVGRTAAVGVGVYLLVAVVLLALALDDLTEDIVDALLGTSD